MKGLCPGGGDDGLRVHAYVVLALVCIPGRRVRGLENLRA